MHTGNLSANEIKCYDLYGQKTTTNKLQIFLPQLKNISCIYSSRVASYIKMFVHWNVYTNTFTVMWLSIFTVMWAVWLSPRGWGITGSSWGSSCCWRLSVGTVAGLGWLLGGGLGSSWLRGHRGAGSGSPLWIGCGGGLAISSLRRRISSIGLLGICNDRVNIKS